MQLHFFLHFILCTDLTKSDRWILLPVGCTDSSLSLENKSNISQYFLYFPKCLTITLNVFDIELVLNAEVGKYESKCAEHLQVMGKLTNNK